MIFLLFFYDGSIKAGDLLYLLLQLVKYGSSKELAQRHFQPIAELLDQIDGNLFAARVKHTIHAGGRDAAAGGELVGAHVALGEDGVETGNYGFFDGHFYSPSFEVKELFHDGEWEALSAPQQRSFGRYFAKIARQNEVEGIKFMPISKNGRHNMYKVY